jgi:hypothetical protein
MGRVHAKDVARFAPAAAARSSADPRRRSWCRPAASSQPRARPPAPLAQASAAAGARCSRGSGSPHAAASYAAR